ncbi:hypothetical protein M409DRAFT_37534 [Zasmidium cellare ATCC 36951]|uniref:AAA+ ATPase domain-containing protein n=1 Tax=Zasmidium cellare ATCC 36951 TaxID=1080233 RepID=A0A6A6C830_ZASCE|nr:uncharacterized protein M409DRAFT_37534 [Zasmidium cellare ATCC 36951]KAF2161566.1 hypothetical protein M409DRAFT_37534 [Zasmidium cellare ATCC 36951]
MARTLQTARKSTGGRPPARGAPVDTNVVDIPDMDEATAQKLQEIKEGSMQALVKHIDRKHTEKGQVYFTETTEDEDIPEQVNWWSKFAMCLVRYLDNSNKYVQKIALQINSKHLKDILRDTIGTFPGVSFQTKDITIDAPYRVLFHYKSELEEAGKKLDQDSEAKAHLDLLLDFIYQEFKDTIEETENLLEQGLISYQHLWTIFRPKTIIYAPVFGQARCFELTSYAYTEDGLQINSEYVDFDGDDFGKRNAGRLVPGFAGAERIEHLSAYPISYHANEKALREELIARGKRWEAYAGMYFQRYQGVALEHTPCGMSRFNVDGRVVVDTKTFHRLNANLAYSVNPFKDASEKRAKRRRIQSFDDEEDEENGGETLDLVPDTRLDLDPLSDARLLLSNATVRGFSFTEKRWFEFFVDKLLPAGWNPNCFDQVVLPQTQKDLVQALVANHIQQRNHSFDDIVKGKGKGLILVLHGPPGVGKTLTAETVAEFCKRPLYMVSSGDLGTESSTLDERLTRILDMASTWRAVLLIDEADVFLERRSLHDMERNSLVSISLRVLEYYSGILFLTSNRVSCFDDAMKSRIHVPLKYSDLTPESRKTIWRNFLQRERVQVDEEGYERLAQAGINGRQIKNVIRTAGSLAQWRGVSVDCGLLEQVIRIQVEFEEELEGKAGMVNGLDGKGEGKGVNGVVVNGH